MKRHEGGRGYVCLCEYVCVNGCKYVYVIGCKCVSVCVCV
jgi:hypothetical protein